jgi:phosphoserine phosphatase RsbU/P
VNADIFFLILNLIAQACFVVVIVYLLSYTQFFKAILHDKHSIALQLVLALIFGVLAIYGTYSGVKTGGAIANIRNLSPIVAGLLAGPWAGLGAGLIGGIHRYFMGGFTQIPCAIGTVLAGLLAGLLFKLLKSKIGIWKPTLFAFCIEVLDMGLLLLIAQPFTDVWNLVQIISLPMIIGDTAGVAIFAFMVKNLKKA